MVCFDDFGLWLNCVELLFLLENVFELIFVKLYFSFLLCDMMLISEVERIVLDVYVKEV